MGRQGRNRYSIIRERTDLTLEILTAFLSAPLMQLDQLGVIVRCARRLVACVLGAYHLHPSNIFITTIICQAHIAEDGVE